MLLDRTFLQYFSNNISLQFASLKPQNVLQGTKINKLGKEKKRKGRKISVWKAKNKINRTPALQMNTHMTLTQEEKKFKKF